MTRSSTTTSWSGCAIPLLTVPYFEVLQILPAIEDGYVAFERAETA